MCGYKVKLTSLNGEIIIYGILTYADENVYIVKDYYGHEGIYPTNKYTYERDGGKK